MADMGIEAEALEVYHHSHNVADFGLVAAPVHLSPGNPALAEAKRLGKRIITHHRAVGEIVGQSLNPNIAVFEVTGTHSKTSTALLLSKILSSQKMVVSHTTRGLEIWHNGEARVLQTGLSITPANVIPAFAAAEAQEAEAMVSEVSLGGTGIADYSILTSFSGDYRIAGGTKWASTAKLQMVSLAKVGSRLIANTDTGLSADFSFGAGGFVQAEQQSLLFGRDSVALDLGEDLDFQGYKTAIAGAAAAAKSAGFSIRQIVSAMEDFEGFSGRMKVTRQGGVTILDSSNSGLKVRDVSLAMDRSAVAAAAGSGLALVVGEESETVCEGMNVPELVDLLRERRGEIDLLVLVGERLAPFAAGLGAKTARGLLEGSLQAQRSGLERLLLCVKCFR
jgi:UDP-N-acetylmuramyl pentapeptide synthase